MQIFGSQITSTPVMSLQTGEPLAVLSNPVINPDNLKIIAYYLEGPRLDNYPSFIRIEDIREIANQGAIIDSSEDIVSQDDIISLKKIIQINFKLLGIKVVEETGRKIGKVSDYTVDVKNFFIVQLYIQNNRLRNFNESTVIVHRDQIIEVSDNQIVVKSTAIKDSESVPVFVNPFGKSQKAQLESLDSVS